MPEQETSYEKLRRLMLANTKIDEAYYLFARRMGAQENSLTLLYALDDGRPHTQKQVCADWLLPKTTVNTVTKELAAAGYLQLLRGQHGREKVLVLTAAGKIYTEKLLQPLYRAEQAAIDRALARFTPEFIEAMDYFSVCLCAELGCAPGAQTEPTAGGGKELL